MDQSNCTNLFHATNGSSPIDMVTDTSNGTYLSENPVGMDIGIYLNENAPNANIGIFAPEELMQSDNSCHTNDNSMDVSDMHDYQMELTPAGVGNFLVLSCESFNNTDENLIDMTVDSQATEIAVINIDSHLTSTALVIDSNDNTVATSMLSHLKKDSLPAFETVTAISSKSQASICIIPDVTTDHDYAGFPPTAAPPNSSTPSALSVPAASPAPINSSIASHSSISSNSLISSTSSHSSISLTSSHSPASTNAPEQLVSFGPAELSVPLNSSIPSNSSTSSTASALPASSVPSLSPNPLIRLQSLSPSTSTDKPPSDYALTRNVLVKEAADILMSTKHHTPKVSDVRLLLILRV